LQNVSARLARRAGRPDTKPPDWAATAETTPATIKLHQEPYRFEVVREPWETSALDRPPPGRRKIMNGNWLAAHRMDHRTDSFILWRNWLIGSCVALAAVAGLVFWGGYHGGLLLGWAVGMVLAATLILFRRRS